MLSAEALRDKGWRRWNSNTDLKSQTKSAVVYFFAIFENASALTVPGTAGLYLGSYSFHWDLSLALINALMLLSATKTDGPLSDQRRERYFLKPQLAALNASSNI